MKIYKYYFLKQLDKRDLSDNMSEIQVLQSKYPLYAITNDKKLAEQFESERNMKLFTKKVSEGVDLEDYQKYTRIHRGCVLCKMTFTMKAYTEKGYEESKPVAVTEIEKTTITDELEVTLRNFNLNFFSQDITSKMFKGKLKKYLEKSYYDTASYFFTTDLPFVDDYPEWMIDELRLFIYLFGDTL